MSGLRNVLCQIIVLHGHTWACGSVELPIILKVTLAEIKTANDRHLSNRYY